MEMNNVTNINNTNGVSRVGRMIKRGDIFWINFGDGNVVGSEQAKDLRPAIVISNDTGNKFSPIIIVALITGQLSKAKLPVHVEIGSSCGLPKDSLILCEQIKSVDKQRIDSFVCHVNQNILNKVDKSIEISLSTGESKYYTMSREEQTANMKAQQIHSADNALRELIQENESLKLIDKYTNKRANKINELKEYCKLNGLDYTRFYSMVTTDTRAKQYN